MSKCFYCYSAVLLIALFAGGCDHPADVNAVTVDGAEFHARLLAIAANYQTFGRFDETLRFGPVGCLGVKAEPSQIRMSKSAASEQHGKKLYYLYPKYQSEYGSAADQAAGQPVGQTIVKEAWKPTPSADKPSTNTVRDPEDKQRYTAGDKLSLFIMTKLPADTPGTDQGWVYGTVSADGKTVTSAGRVQNCMNCHQRDNTTDRMFGVEAAEPVN